MVGLVIWLELQRKEKRYFVSAESIQKYLSETRKMKQMVSGKSVRSYTVLDHVVRAYATEVVGEKLWKGICSMRSLRKDCSEGRGNWV